MKAPTFAAVLALTLDGAAGARIDPCTADGTSLVGEVIIGSLVPGTVEIEWSINEDPWTREYRLTRRPASCEKPSCETRIGRIKAASGSGFATYSLTDTASPGTWIYSLQVVRSHGGSCEREVTVDVPPFPSCDSSVLCAQLRDSFAGRVVVGTLAPSQFQLHWMTTGETPAIRSYRLSRYDCAVPRDCTREVATLEATGTCGRLILHSVSDDPAPGNWTYRLEALDSGSRSVCTIERRLDR